MTWTPDRPTKPGKYWLSVHPSKRPGEQRPDVMFPHAIACEVTQVVEWMLGEFNANALDHEQRRFAWAVKYLSGGPWLRLLDSWFDGAKWLPYVEPPDPFAEPVPKPVEQLPSDAELVKSAIRLMRTPRRRYSRSGSQRPLWSRVMMLFGHGSTYSRAICRAHGFDPDEVWMIEEAPQ